MTASRRQSLGRKGESLALDFLVGEGYSLRERNYRTPYGEVDLVMQAGDGIIFVEVKTRSSKSLGPPEISITPRKQEHMRSAANYYIQQHTDLQADWRIDVLAIQLLKGEAEPIIEHFENVLS